MLMNNMKFMFIMLILISGFMGWSMNNWFALWLTMELMFFFFLGLVNFNLNYLIVEFMIKFFIIQVFVSLLIVIFFLFTFFNVDLQVGSYIFLLFFIKLGLFPFHMWVIMLIGKIDWMSFFVMMSFMKLLPMQFVYFTSLIENIKIFLLVSLCMGSVLGLNNLIIQKLLVYSSMVHMTWMLISLDVSLKVFLLYFLGYAFMNLMLCGIFFYFKIFFLNQLKFEYFNVFYKVVVIFLILSLNGFPPFLGFFMKIAVLKLFFFFKI